jgi:hypothetical protein
MDEQQFLLKLEERANEQEKLIEHLHAPEAVFGVSVWLGRHPWRFLIPFSFLLSLLCELLFGSRYTEGILWIFGGL